LTASGGGTYQWTGGPATATYTVSPTSTTTYTVVVTDGNGCTATASRVVNVTPNLVAFITPNNPDICSGDTVTLTASGGTNYQWTGGPASSIYTVSPTTTTTYTVSVTDGGSCSATASATVT